MTASKTKQINEVATGHRVLDIAQARDYSIKIFRYDLIPTSYLYDEEAIKECLCHEIEKCLNSVDRVPPSGLKSLRTAYLVDVIANHQENKIQRSAYIC